MLAVFSSAMSLPGIFVKDDKLRAGWRLLIWFIIAYGIESALQFAASRIVPSVDSPPFLTAPFLLASDVLLLTAVLVATLVMARIEHFTLRDYYIPPYGLLDRQFWRGLLWGFLAVSLLVGLIAALHGYRITGVALHGWSLVKATLLWLAAALAIGVAEEVAFRGYMLRTLADGIRFWPAAILLSIGFGALHYFFKPYERWEDFASTGLLALFGCLTIRRTDSLAFVIGFHASFDWGTIFFYSGRNGGEFAVGHLVRTVWDGPFWLTGGMLGPEASWLVFIVIALLFLCFSWAYSPAALSSSSATPRPSSAR